MNRYPIWKYLTVLAAVVIGLLYTLPNFFGEAPAVQVSSAKATIKVELEKFQRKDGGDGQKAKVTSVAPYTPGAVAGASAMPSRPGAAAAR